MNIGEEFARSYKNGLEIDVNFTKKNGTERKMRVKRDAVLESQITNSDYKAAPGQIHVIEHLEDGGKQWRTIDLSRVNHFTIL